jgi:hypothetical protein
LRRTSRGNRIAAEEERVRPLGEHARKLNRRARRAELEKLKVRTTVVVADSAGFGARARGKVKVGV